MDGSDEMYFDGARFISASSASKEFGFVRDYIARLCRQGLVRGRQVGKNWYVDHRALQTFVTELAHRKERNREELRRERRAERSAAEAAPSRNLGIAPAPQPRSIRGSGRALMTAPASDGRNQFVESLRARTTARAASIAQNTSGRIPPDAVSPAFELLHKVLAATLALALVVGLYAAEGSLISTSPEFVPGTNITPSGELTAASGFLGGTFGQIAGLFEKGADAFLAPLYGVHLAQENSSQGVVAIQVTPIRSGAPLATSQTVTKTVIENPIVDRVVQSENVIASGGITEDELTQQLQELDNSLTEKINIATAANSTVIAQNYGVTAQTNAIDELTNTTITNPSISGGSIANSDISGATISNSTFTGTTTLGSLAVSSSATSTFSGGIDLAGGCFAINGTCISGGSGGGTPGGLNTEVQFNGNGVFSGSDAFTFSTSTETLSVLNASTTNATTTNLVAVNATSTNFFATNASTTNATSTNLFAAVGDLTTGLINTLSGTTLTYTAASTTNISASGEGYFGTASTTNLTVSGAPSGFLQTNAQGAVSATSTFSASSIFGTLGVGNGGTGTSTAPSYGQLLVGSAAGGYNLAATSTLGLPTFADLSSNLGNYLSLSSWYATTTNGLVEGSNNLYFTNNRVASAIAGTTTDALKEESTNLYFTNARAQNAISVLGSPLTYSSGVIGINQSSGSQPGYLSSADWSTFNGKIALTSLSGTYPIQYNSGTGAISLAFGTTTSNTWAGTQTFSNLSATNATSTNLFASVGDLTTGLINTLSGTTLTYTAASTTNLSNFGTAYFGGTATSSFDSAGDLSVAGTLNATGKTTLGNASTSLLSVSSNSYLASAQVSALALGNAISCSGSQALQTDGSGNVSCGPISVGGASAGGGWIANGGSVNGTITESTSTYLVAVGATSTPYAKFTVLSGANGTTTLALVPASSQTANILDIYAPGGGLNSVLTAGGNLGIGTTSPTNKLEVAGNTFLGGNLTTTGTLNVVGQTTLANASTSILTNSGATWFTGAGLASALLATDANGKLVATTSVSVNYLTGILSIANGGTGSTTLSGLLKGNGTGAVQTAVGGTDYEFPLTFSTGLNRTGNTITDTGVLSLGSGYATTTGTSIALSTTTQSFNGLTIAQTIISPNGSDLLFAPNVSGTLNNSGLTNSTISGVSLGSNLNSLTATNGTLTLTGSYNGSSAQTVGLNLGNANTWTGLQSFANASSSLFSVIGTAYFGGSATSTFDSAGDLSVAGTLKSTGLSTLASGFVSQASSTVVGAFTAAGGLTVGNATSTFANGITLTTGCVFYNGSCIGANSGTVNSGTQGQFAFYASNGSTLSGTSTLFVTQAGNIGIGTTTPGDVSGANQYLTIASNGVHTSPALELSGNTNVGGAAVGRISFFNQQGQDEDARISTIIGSDTGSGSIIFSTGNAGALGEAARIDNNGNVGIGTTSPTNKLEVAGNTFLGGNLTTTGTLNVVGQTTLANASTTELTNSGATWFTGAGLASALLSTDANGKLVATTSVGGNYLTGILSIANGGSNASSFTSGQLLSFDGTRFVSTSTIGNNQLANSSLTVSAGSGLSSGGLVSLGGSTSLSLDLTHANNWTGLQIFANASSTLETDSTLWLPNLAASSLLYTNSSSQVAAAAVSYPLQFASGSLSTAFGTTTPNSFSQLQTFSGGASTTLFSAYGPTYFGGTGTSTFTSGGVLGVGTTSPSGSNLFAVAGTSYFAGNVGIGSTTPGYALSVNGGDIWQTAGAPTLASTTSLTVQNSGGFNGGGFSVAIQGRYAYVIEGPSGPAVLEIFDISNPYSPQFAGSFSPTGNTFNDVRVSGKYAYLGSSSGLWIADISNPSNVVLLGKAPNGGGSRGGYVSGKYYYGTQTSTLLDVTDVSNPLAPVTVSQTSLGATSVAERGVFVSGQYAYVVGNQSGSTKGFNVVDISNPALPVVAGAASTTASTGAQSVYVSGKYAYVAEQDGSLEVFDISNPAVPVSLSDMTPTGLSGLTDITVAGNYAYLDSQSSNNFDVVNISNPAAPITVATFTLANHGVVSVATHAIEVSGKYAYLAENSGGTNAFQILDLSGIEAPAASIGSLDTNQLQVDENAYIGGDIYTGGGLNVGMSGIFSRGGIFSYVASSTATNPISAAFMGGNVGIGTTTPYSRLTVWGKDTASTTALEVDNSASTTVFGVFDNGNATLSGSLVQNSDQRLKTNIQSLDASSSLSAIELLNPVTFNWVDPNKGTTAQLGFIAQQVLSIFPSLVSTTSPTALTPDGTLSVNYIGLIAPIVKALQEIASVEGTFQQNLIAWLGNAENGVVDLFAENGHFSNELGVGATCVTPAQFQALVAAANVPQSSGQGSGAAPSLDASTTPSAPPIIQINGDNPAIIQVGATYNDLGATITGPQADLNLGITTYVNGAPMNPVQLDTSEAATDTIDYVATDQFGLTSTSTRTIIIESAAAPSIVPTDDASSTATTTTQMSSHVEIQPESSGRPISPRLLGT